MYNETWGLVYTTAC